MIYILMQYQCNKVIISFILYQGPSLALKLRKNMVKILNLSYIQNWWNLLGSKNFTKFFATKECWSSMGKRLSTKLNDWVCSFRQKFRRILVLIFSNLFFWVVKMAKWVKKSMKEDWKSAFKKIIMSKFSDLCKHFWICIDRQMILCI